MTKKGYYQTEDSVKEYIELAKEVNGKDLIEKLKTLLVSNAKLLEIGSGPGSDWKILNESYKVIGSDNSQEFLRHLKATIPNGEFLKLDAVSLNTNQKFDGIYSNKVLHHLRDDELKLSVKNQYRILNAHGIICHSFWRGEGSEFFKGLLVNYQSKNSLHKIYGGYFELLTIETYKEFEDNDSLFIIGKKK